MEPVPKVLEVSDTTMYMYSRLVIMGQYWDISNKCRSPHKYVSMGGKTIHGSPLTSYIGRTWLGLPFI